MHPSQDRLTETRVDLSVEAALSFLTSSSFFRFVPEAASSDASGTTRAVFGDAAIWAGEAFGAIVETLPKQLCLPPAALEQELLESAKDLESNVMIQAKKPCRLAIRQVSLPKQTSDLHVV